MENNLTAQEKRKKFLLELKDMLAGAAFPFMLMLVLSASVISFVSSMEDIGLQILLLALGELMIAAAYCIFGRQNGVTACRRSVQNQKKRDLDMPDMKARFRTGEYALYKGFLIGFLSCVPFIIFQIIGSAAPNKVIEFILIYAFGWAVMPFRLAGISSWLNLIWVIPLTCVHAAAYYIGYRLERKKQKKISAAQEVEAKSGKK